VEENKEPKEIWKLFKDLNPKKQNHFPPFMKFENETCSDFKDISKPYWLMRLFDSFCFQRCMFIDF
jgi:hypothetical protein